MFFSFNLVTNINEKKQLNNGAQYIDLNSYRVNINENYNLDLLNKNSLKSNKEN